MVFMDRSGKVDFPGQMGTPAKGNIVRVTAIKQGMYLEWEGTGITAAGTVPACPRRRLDASETAFRPENTLEAG